MNLTPRDESSPHSSISRVAADFDAQCSAGSIPAIEPYLDRIDGGLRDALLIELVRCETRHRRNLGLSDNVGRYRQRYPHLIAALDEQFGQPRAEAAQDVHVVDPDATSRDGFGLISPDAKNVVKPSVQHSDDPHADLTPVDPPLGPSGEGDDSRGKTHADRDQETVLKTIHDGSSTTGKILNATAAPTQVDRYRVDGVLGEGGFGVVYLGFDPELQRKVAIKIAHRRGQSERELEELMNEARMLARLDHAHIVPVHDVGRDAQLGVYIISKYIEGGSLRDQLHEVRSATEIAELIARIADALHDAHKQGVVHRDIKPSNILLDAAGHPFIVDFGLALADSDLKHRNKSHAGTPAYMSPEQALGEGHRVDGRSDIFSLAVILYEMIAGCRPFRAADLDDLLEQIADRDPRPPRQIRDQIPVELERICLKGLAKRASDRYTTAHDMASDLRAFADNASNTATLGAPGLQSKASDVASQSRGSDVTFLGDSSRSSLTIVPKGLRSFDQHDADFFLELLPGPRDRDGLPESIRFWKTRIEETDPAQTFNVGLIYGPSGCGKSSLVKAGLLPKLKHNVVVVYCEATSDKTEHRLLAGLRREFPSLPASDDLKTTLFELRKNPRLANGRKVVMIIDQFEQWLHAHRAEHQSEMVRALRQCDATQLQAIVMVRDDFWMAATRFMRQLEVPLVEGQNSNAVDLFPTRHATKVLTAFGRAHGAISDEITASQKAFIQQATKGLAEDGHVICVRLALFAEMMKNRPWTIESLRAVGGTHGVGTGFLEETFSANHAPPEHRFHQAGARNVLRALLPELGTDIKGHMRSAAELRQAAGYVDRPEDFTALLRILDQGLRLITPTDPDGIVDADSPSVPAKQLPPPDRPPPDNQPDNQPDGDDPVAGDSQDQYFQLAHDYLVPSLRSWLTRKQQETRKGRAELCLQLRSEQWRSNHETRHLPSLPELCGIQFLTNHQEWNASQQQLMLAARRYHLRQLALIAAAVAILFIVGLQFRQQTIENRNRQAAEGYVTALLTAGTASVPELIAQLEDYRKWADPILLKKSTSTPADSSARLHANLALMGQSAASRDQVLANSIVAGPVEITSICAVVATHDPQPFIDGAWQRLISADSDHRTVLPSAALLATFDPKNPQWADVAPRVADVLLRDNPLRVSAWMPSLEPVRQALLPSLSRGFRNDDNHYSSAQRELASQIVEQYAQDDVDTLVELLVDGTPDQFLTLFDEVRAHGQLAIDRLTQFAEVEVTSDDQTAHRTAVAVAALLRMDRPWPAWHALRFQANPRIRSYAIHRFADLEVDAQVLIDRMLKETDRGVKQALLLALGNYPKATLTARETLAPMLLELFEHDPDAAIHGAAEWLLTQMGYAEDVARGQANAVQHAAAWTARVNTTLADGETPAWFVNTDRQTMVVLSAGTVQMGSPTTEPGRTNAEVMHRRVLNRRFAIGAAEITRGQFERFMNLTGEKGVMDMSNNSQTGDCPAIGVTWYLTAKYCNWLSEQDGIPADQWVYEPNEQGEFDEGMIVRDDALTRRGYRLPTEAEWVHAARAGTTTARHYGFDTRLLAQYACFQANSFAGSRPVTSFKPNDFGLFDMLGNVWEWCLDPYTPYEFVDGKTIDDFAGSGPVLERTKRPARGGSFANRVPHLRVANRFQQSPSNMSIGFGFRVVCGLPPHAD